MNEFYERQGCLDTAGLGQTSLLVLERRLTPAGAGVGRVGVVGLLHLRLLNVPVPW